MIPENIIPKAQQLYDFAVALGHSHASAIGVCSNVMAERKKVVLNVDNRWIVFNL